MNLIAWWFCYAREKCDKYSELPSFYLLVMLFKFNKIFILTYFQIIDVWMPEKPGKLSQLSDGSYHINILSWLPDGCYSNCQMAVTPALRMLVSRLSDGCYPGSQMAVILALSWVLVDGSSVTSPPSCHVRCDLLSQLCNSYSDKYKWWLGPTRSFSTLK